MSVGHAPPDSDRGAMSLSIDSDPVVSVQSEASSTWTVPLSPVPAIGVVWAVSEAVLVNESPVEVAWPTRGPPR